MWRIPFSSVRRLEPETLDLFDEYGVSDFLDEPPLQWQCIENTVVDIEDYIKARS